MADSSISYTKPQLPPRQLNSTAPSKPMSTTNRKSYTRIFCKSLFFLLFLVAIPLFPSQAPNFINQTILNKFWEVLHLLFVGLAVCYGLFSRRNVEPDFEPNINLDDSQSSYVSRIFHVSPFFEDGSEIPSGSDQQNNMYQTWGYQYHRGESESMVTVSSENGKGGSLESKNEFYVPLEGVDENVLQAWNSQFFQQAEPMVAVSQKRYALDDSGKPREMNGCEPLGLPIRSLESRIRTQDGPRFSDGSEFCSSLDLSSSSSRRILSEKEFGNMDPLNLEESFNETVSMPSQIPWQSRSGRMEMGDKSGYTGTRPSHFRPLSVDETQFESLKSPSFWSTASFSSQATSASCSPTRSSPSHSESCEFPNLEVEESGMKKDFQASSFVAYAAMKSFASRSESSELPNSKVEESGTEKNYRASYPPASQSLQARLNGEAPLNAFHLRRYSSGSLFGKDLKSKAKLKELGGKGMEDSFGSKDRGNGSSKLAKEAAKVVKASSRGKSVRTIRGSRCTAEGARGGEHIKTHTDNEIGKVFVGNKAANGGRSDIKVGGLDDMAVDTDKENLDTVSHVPKPMLMKHQKREKKGGFENVTREPEEDLMRKTENSQVSSEEASMTESVNDGGQDPNEVDKKASEFIARFREQIRLQKAASIERSRAKNMSKKSL